MIINKVNLKTWFLIPCVLLIGIYSCTTDRPLNPDDYEIDTDGDGITDDQEILDGTDRNNPCDPAQRSGYAAYDPLNLLWSASDCDNDGVNNGDELAIGNSPYGDPDNPMFAVPEFLPKLSELQLYQGNLSDFDLNTNVHEYHVSTPLFSDYAYSFKVIALPNGAKMTYDGPGLFLFPENTILAKSIYYLNDERNATLGKKVIETQVLIKKDGAWQVGNYLWNNEQTEAFLDSGAHTVPVEWIDATGADRSVAYKVTSKIVCFQCHNNNGNTQPIGPKARALNYVYDGKNQIDNLKEKGLLANTLEVSQIAVLPDWSNPSFALEERARAYLDVNCAHCHQPGGSYNVGHDDSFGFRFESSFEDSGIYQKRVDIKDRMNTQTPAYFMPYIGTTVLHTEGVELINEYIDSM
ncbi:MAG: hypothetical protein WBM83_10015 [Flavobacteriaceae bacterium]